MSEHTRLQLRLQQTLEGLSIVGISDYVIGFAAHVFQGAKEAGLTRGHLRER